MKKIFIVPILMLCLICSCCSLAYADPDVVELEESEGLGTLEELPDMPEAILLETDTELFLYKDFNAYTVTEGFLLLFLILVFCWVCWIIIRGGVFRV